MVLIYDASSSDTTCGGLTLCRLSLVAELQHVYAELCFDLD
jgi:hypothetical protein